MSDLPDPMTPPDCDLRGFEWMPLFGARLFTSTFEAHASDLAFRIAIRLYWECWLQVPAASLPNDDVMLCRLAGLGRDIRTWRKLRADGVLHGFILCNDDRLYHRMLADEAVKALACKLRSKQRDERVADEREQAKARMRRMRERQRNGNNDDPSYADVTRNRAPPDQEVTRNSYAESRHVTPGVTPLVPITQYQVTSTEKKEDVRKNPLPPKDLVGSRAREEDSLNALLDEAGIDLPHSIERHDDEPLSDNAAVAAHIRRTAKSMQMRIADYGVVRAPEAQQAAILAQPQAVGADVAMGMRWAPADPQHDTQQQIAAAERSATPEQIEKARRAFAARARRAA